MVHFFFNFLAGNINVAFYWAVPIGIILGVATCIYLANTWDPVHLRPINPNTKKADNRIFWLVPIGIILARLLPLLIGDEIADSLGVCGFIWVTFTFGYMIIQIWRYRPK